MIGMMSYFRKKKALIKAFKEATPYMDRRKNNPGRPSTDYMELADDFLTQWKSEGILGLRLYRDQFYYFNGNSYKPYQSLKYDIMEFMQSTNDSTLREIKKLQQLKINGEITESLEQRLKFLMKSKVPCTSNAARHIQANLESYRNCAIPYEVSIPCSLEQEDNFQKLSNIIAFSNGKMINIDSYLEKALKGNYTDAEKCIKDTTPAIFNINAVDYPLNLDNKECPSFKEFLKGVQPNKRDREILQMLMGLMLIPDCSYNIITFILGPSGTGKTQFTDILKGVIGEDNVCSVQPHMMIERFQTRVLTEKLVNCVGDLAATTDGKSWASYEGILKERVLPGTFPLREKAVLTYPLHLILPEISFVQIPCHSLMTKVVAFGIELESLSLNKTSEIEKPKKFLTSVRKF